MEMRESIKDRSAQYAVSKIIDLLSRVSLDSFVHLTYWGEKLTSDPEVRGGIAHIRRFPTQDDHPARHLFSSVLTTLSWNDEYLGLKETSDLTRHGL